MLASEAAIGLMPRKGGAGKEHLPEFFGYNRRAIEEWLYYFSEMYQQGYASGVPRDRFLKEVAGGGSGAGMAYHHMLRLEHPDVYASHKACLEAVAVLEEGRWREYVTISPCYLWESSNPGLVDAWLDRARRDESASPDERAGARAALADHDEAIRYMAGFVCERLPHLVEGRHDDEGNLVEPREPLLKLKLKIPRPIKAGHKKYRQDGRREAWEKFNELMEAGKKRPDAIKEGAKATNYSLTEFRYIVRGFEAGKWSP